MAGTSTGLNVPSPAAARSRATPITPMQSGRSGVIATSNTGEASLYSAKLVPTGASSGSSIIPSCSSPSSSSRTEHIMPFDSTPRIALLRSSMPLAGPTAPGRPSTPFMPARALGAPQTTCSGSPSPVSTLSTCSLSASGCLAAVSTLATRNPASLSAGSSMPSTSWPIRLSAAAISGTEASVSRKCSSHSSENFMPSLLRLRKGSAGRTG